ncbi:unnamed protein product [Strongylus vulgaris]|uniref:Carboxylesterase type B domain-containing protein n=1 Tax=Strongylus vulgaris TaxID=40348 RepID=A0A3P7KCL5_STRVU|nr:unnamed protein product [Strongylus vulgaris]
MFKDEALVNNFAGNDIVLVIPGFRLGFLGLLTFNSDKIVPRNIAAYDLLAALHFVKDEIKHFGGNPNDVTLFGHSEGATASAQFAFSKQIDPEGKLFQKAVMMSMHYAFANLTHLEDVTMELAYRLKCSPARGARNLTSAFVNGVVTCLRNISSIELLRVQREMEDENERLKPELLLMTAPLFDAKDLQEFLSDPPLRTILVGSTLNEMDFSYDPAEIDIIKLLSLKNRQEVVERFRRDASLKKLRK